jgi:hypothetical protein
MIAASWERAPRLTIRTRTKAHDLLAVQDPSNTKVG